jgi:hypothetical protein
MVLALVKMRLGVGLGSYCNCWDITQWERLKDFDNWISSMTSFCQCWSCWVYYLWVGCIGALASTKVATLGLLKVGLLLFRRVVLLANAFNLLTWWAKHEQYFSNISHLAWQFMGIINFQIEIEFFFSMVGVIIGLKLCWLGIDNLDKLVFIMKN